MAARADTWTGRRLLALRKMAPIAGLVVVPAILWPYIVWAMLDKDAFAVDFHYAFWPAGQDVLHGRTPYLPLGSPLVEGGNAFVYPAFTAVLFVLPALIPLAVSELLFVAALLGATVLTLKVCGVRDWRCYAVLALWPPVVSGLQTANLTPFLALGVAGVWRRREQLVAPAAIVATMLASKLFLWPLLVWLLALRRYRTAGVSLVLVVALSLIGWIVVGFGEFDHFRAILRRVTELEERESYTPFALAVEYGAGPPLAHALTWALGAGLLAGAWVLGRSGRPLRSLELALAGAIALSPIAWLHYLMLLLVPLALKRPSFSAIWLLPAVLWVCPPGNGNGLQTLLVVLVGAALVAAPHEPRRWSRRTGRGRRQAALAS